MVRTLSEDEAMEMVLSVVASPEIYTTPTPTRPGLIDRINCLSPATPETELPKVSRFWPQVDSSASIISQEEPLQNPTPLPTDFHHQRLQCTEPGLETDDQAGTCRGKLCGLPCFWCLEEPVQDSDKVAAKMATNGGPLNQPAGTGADQFISENSEDMRDSTLAEALQPREKRGFPPVLYRWSNINSQGINGPDHMVAGMFLSENPFPPKALPEQYFLGMFKSHVTKAPVPTPFISTFQSPLAPIHRSLHNGQGAKVSIIDMSKLSTAVFKAAPLVEHTNTGLPNWKGYGEYLIWHEVPASAIACSFTIKNLEDIASAFTDIGQFLQLHLIKKRHHCTRFLYSDLAAGIPSSQDGHITTLERLTTLLGVPDTIKEQVIEDLRHAWTKKFWGLHFEMPEDRVVHPPNPEYEFELHGSAELLLNSQTGQRQPSRGRSLSHNSYRPSVIDADGSSSGGASDPPIIPSSEEPEAKCPRRDTPSDGYSVCDDSSEEDWHRPAANDDFETMEEDQDEDTDWPSDGEISETSPICWRASLQD